MDPQIFLQGCKFIFEDEIYQYHPIENPGKYDSLGHVSRDDRFVCIIEKVEKGFAYWFKFIMGKECRGRFALKAVKEFKPVAP